MSATPLDTLTDLVAPLLDGRRVLIGVAGAPGSGKSTIAAELVRRLDGVRAVVVPLDGFHLANEELDRLGLARVKGAPETFDAWGFVHLLGRLKTGAELIYAPMFHRAVEQAISGAIPIPVDTELVVVEGNYLLLADEPWSLGRPLFDLAVYLDVPAAVRVPRLLDRARDGGRDAAAAEDWVYRNDEANARRIASSRERADVLLVP